MSNEKKSGAGVAVFGVLHLLCYGIPLLLLSGISLAFVRPAWTVIRVLLAVLGIAGFIWYLKRGCSTYPRNEGDAVWRDAMHPKVNVGLGFILKESILMGLLVMFLGVAALGFYLIRWYRHG